MWWRARSRGFTGRPPAVPDGYLRVIVGTDQQAAIDALVGRGARRGGGVHPYPEAAARRERRRTRRRRPPGRQGADLAEVVHRDLGEQVRRLQYDTFLEHFGNMSKTPEVWRHHLESRSFAPDFSIAAVTDERGEVIGYVLGSIFTAGVGASEERSAHTDYIGVRRRSATRGIGEFLLKKIWLAALRRGFTVASLGTDINNRSNAHVLYRRLGYIAVEQQFAYRIERGEVEMSSITDYLATPTADIDELAAHFRPVFDKIARGQRRAGEGPHVPARAGASAQRRRLRDRANPGGSRRLRGLAGADVSVARRPRARRTPTSSHIWRNHLAFVEDRLNAAGSDANDVWIKRFLGGEFVGGGWTEANNVTLANLATTVTAEDDHLLVTGAKYYATGQLVRRLARCARSRRDDGELLTALVRVRRPGRHAGRRLARFRAAHHRQRQRRATSNVRADRGRCVSRPPSGSPTRGTSIRSRCSRC